MDNCDEIGVVVLAAGKGTRMQSDKAKVLHCVHGRSMLSHVLDCAVKVSCGNVVVVVGHQAERVKDAVKNQFDVAFAHQKELLGTGDAVRAALPHFESRVRHVVVLCGDTPLVKARTVKGLVEVHRKFQNKLTVLAVDLDEPTGYGRMMFDDDEKLVSIREEVDASPDEKKITLVNSGIYCVEKQFLTTALNRLKPDNAQSEYYLTDVVGIATSGGYQTGYVRGENAYEVLGVNTPAQLKTAESLSKGEDV
ncbi:MAG: NTP transferase domain-containing protein [Desulfobacteraceae bacterium]|nr:NTP transferase domain-containing protein [Desulfobacteraceae bacterium]